jgi:tryptophan-rich sensory protein
MYASSVKPISFAALALALGMLPLPLAFALAPPGGLPASAPGLHLPPWVFATVWTIVYPACGIATWRIWSQRDRAGAREALAVFALAFLFFLAFVPITAAAHDQRVTAMMDIVGLVCGYVAAWAYRRIDRTTTYWLLPLLFWLPTTTFLKLVTL